MDIPSRLLNLINPISTGSLCESIKHHIRAVLSSNLRHLTGSKATIDNFDWGVRGFLQSTMS